MIDSIISAILGGPWQYLAAASGALTLYFFGRRQGSQNERMKAREKDASNAQDIRDRADRARAADDAGHVDALDKLRSSGRIRD